MGIRIPTNCACLRCGRPAQGEPEYDITPASLRRSPDGSFWCSEHDLHRELWEWGAQHHFPEVRTGRYAIAQGRGSWLFTLGFSTDERIAELLCFVMAYDAESPARQQEIQAEVAQDIEQREAAVRRWIAQARSEMQESEDMKHR